MKPQARKYQTATQVKGLSLEIIHVKEVDSVHKLEDNKASFNTVRNRSLFRGLRPWYGIERESQELGRSEQFSCNGVSTNNLKKREGGDGCSEVGLFHSRGVIGVMPCESNAHSKGTAVVCRGERKHGLYKEID